MMVFGYLVKGIDMFLVEAFIAHSVEKSMFEGGA